jgi:hypothetical protein
MEAAGPTCERYKFCYLNVKFYDDDDDDDDDNGSVVSCSKPFSFIFAQFICRSKHYKSDRDIHH